MNNARGIVRPLRYLSYLSSILRTRITCLSVLILILFVFLVCSRSDDHLYSRLACHVGQRRSQNMCCARTCSTPIHSLWRHGNSRGADGNRGRAVVQGNHTKQCNRARNRFGNGSEHHRGFRMGARKKHKQAVALSRVAKQRLHLQALSQHVSTSCNAQTCGNAKSPKPNQMRHKWRRDFIVFAPRYHGSQDVQAVSRSLLSIKVC